MLSPAIYCKLECSIPRQELVAGSRLLVCKLQYIHSVFSCISLFSLHPVDLWDDFHLLLVQEFKVRTILVAVGTLLLSLCLFP